MGEHAEQLTAEALKLPPADRALLVETLLDSLSGAVDPTVQRTHLEEIRRRRDAARARPSELVDGEAALQRARDAVRK